MPVIPASLSTCYFQAMRFPPKSYNKDLESAEVSKNEGWTFSKGSREGFGGQGKAAPPLSEAGSPSLRRNGVSGSSRTWSLPRRWRRMMTTASLEPGLGEGWAEWRLAFIFSLRGPLPGNLASFSHTQLTDCTCAGIRDAGSQLSPLATMPLCSW